MTKPSRIHYHRAQRIYDRLGRGSVADIDSIAQALAEAECGGMKRAAEICVQQKDGFLSAAYAANQPLGSFCERFACDECASAILSEAES